MGEWTDFAVVVGGASAALTGLLFVAISINIGPIGRSIGLRSRGAQTLVLFALPNIITIALTAAAGVLLITDHEWASTCSSRPR